MRSNKKGAAVIAVIDETGPELGGGIHYTVVAAVLVADEEVARLHMATVLPERRRPFHWHQEGPVARASILAAMVEIGVIGRAVVVPCGRRQQEAARRLALSVNLEFLWTEGCSTILIESRDEAGNGRDRATILDHFEDAGQRPSYAWHRKSERLLWIADALGGAVHEHLTGRDEWFAQLSARASSKSSTGSSCEPKTAAVPAPVLGDLLAQVLGLALRDSPATPRNNTAVRHQ